MSASRTSALTGQLLLLVGTLALALFLTIAVFASTAGAPTAGLQLFVFGATVSLIIFVFGIVVIVL